MLAECLRVLRYGSGRWLSSSMWKYYAAY